MDKFDRKGYSVRQLRLVAEDLNQVLGLQPPIQLHLCGDLLDLAIIEASKFVDGRDNLKDSTWRTLEKLELGPIRIRRTVVKATKEQIAEAQKQRREFFTKKTTFDNKMLEIGSKKESIALTIQRFVYQKTINNTLFSREQLLRLLKNKFPKKTTASLKALSNTFTTHLAYIGMQAEFVEYRGLHRFYKGVLAPAYNEERLKLLQMTEEEVANGTQV